MRNNGVRVLENCSSVSEVHTEAQRHGAEVRYCEGRVEKKYLRGSASPCEECQGDRTGVGVSHGVTKARSWGFAALCDGHRFQDAAMICCISPDNEIIKTSALSGKVSSPP